MKRTSLLLMCAMAFLLTVPAIQTSSGVNSACCTGPDRQRCSDLCGGKAYCDRAACLCECPA
jgi:hypothetical protein